MLVDQRFQCPALGCFRRIRFHEMMCLFSQLFVEAKNVIRGDQIDDPCRGHSIDLMAKDVADIGLKVGWYSGEEEVSMYKYGWYFDYIKVGPYNESLGPLNSPTTNQRLYKIGRLYNQGQIISEDITNKFWNK